MKKLFAIALLASFTALAAPFKWTCDWPEAKSQTFSLYQGETATFEPTFRVNGHTVTNATIEAVWYQTNGMDQAWWKLDGNTFAPSNDVGAASYRFFVEAKASGDTIYRANGALRMLPSPGFTPNVISFPARALDFSVIDYTNAPWPNEIAAATNGLLRTESDPSVPAWAKSETQPLPPDYSTVSNKAMTALQSFTETDPTVPEWAKSQTQPLPPDYSTVSNKAMTALQSFTESDPVWESEKEDYATMWDLDDYATVWDLGDLEDRADALEAATNDLATAIGDALGEAKSYTDEQIGYVQDSLTPLTSTINSSIKSASAASTNYTDAATNALAQSNAAAFMPASFTETDPTISSWAKAAQKPTYTASEVGAATAADVYRLIAGTNVVLVVTNYNSQTHAPAMKLQHLDTDSGQYVTYWDETRRHGMTLTNAMNYTDAQIETRAPKAWSGTTSGLGAEAPAGVTWISTPETVIAGGYEYEKVVTSAGAVWILTSNGLSTGATTNSFFRVSASDGTELFSIEKTDSYLVGVSADGLTRSGNTVTVPVNVVGNAHPYIRATTNLVDAVWTKEDENGFSCPWAT
ncbi:MAG: hypothetical protein K6G94_00205, partial [Kiritimatiellae bacterium]|nr:hypothetical protein [Kiritimatiellia bacterium]